MQVDAPECLNIEVLRVNVEPGPNAGDQVVTLVALVHDVTRSATSLKPNDIINIVYTILDRKDMVGPGQVPIPEERSQTIAFLRPGEEGNYAPAAGRMTFSKF